MRISANLKYNVFLILFLCSLSVAFAQDTSATGPKKPRPIFINGEAQVVPEFSNPSEWIREELWVEAPFDSDLDGKPDRMHVFVTRPRQTDSSDLKLPAIYMSSPYYGLKLLDMMTQKKKHFWNIDHEIGEMPVPHKHKDPKTNGNRPMMTMFYDRTWVPRGYIMVYSSSPGTGLSDGAPTIGGENESLAPRAVIDWLCGRGTGFTTRTGTTEVKAYWCSGKVGMTGTSYDGTLCLAAATTGVEGLEAIIPVAPVSSWYHYYRSNGLVKSPGGYPGEDVDVMYDFINSGDKTKRKGNNQRVRDSLLMKYQDRITGDYNAFWESRDYLNQIGNMKAAMLMSHGFNDWNVMPDQSYRFYAAARELGIPVQLYYHQADHGGDPPMQMMNRWFTRYLHGVENGVEGDAPVWIVREGNTLPTAYSSYPDPEAEMVTLYPKKSAGQEGVLITEKPEAQPDMSFTDDATVPGNLLADSTNAGHRVLFVTAPLREDLRISGTPEVTIRLACSKPAANLSVWLVSLPWEEGKGVAVYDNIITRGWADPQNHRSLTESEKLQPGAYYTMTFPLMPDDQVIRKGQQIGLMIFSSDNEFTLRPEPGTMLTIDLNATRLTLPVVGGTSTFHEASGH
ncbi:MAG TPA: Xaa-Pro dipeptidyl-peptidase [Bacteroidales bacterium]|nr:Xaa-Pro dipeptidyl-peptidase [Bacteroidales bacterium]HRZ49003.1 Xaa-Pro dipeptidyl-peptidase [Bacteroidales bacterium]